MTAPYDIPEMISLISQLLLSSAGQETLMRLLGDHDVTLEKLKDYWAKSPKVDSPFIAEDPKQ